MERKATPGQLGFLLPLHYTFVVRPFHSTLAFFLVPLLSALATFRGTKGLCRGIMQGNRPSVPFVTKHFLNLDRSRYAQRKLYSRYHSIRIKTQTGHKLLGTLKATFRILSNLYLFLESGAISLFLLLFV